MKTKIILASVLFNQLLGMAQNTSNDESQTHKEHFYAAYNQIKNMLEGKDSLSYEKAVFITENAYYNNDYNYTIFKDNLDFYTKLITLTAENARQQHADKYKTLTLYQQKMFMQNTANWAIYHFITDTTFLQVSKADLYLIPYTYSTDDPYGTASFENTQVLHLLAEKKGNCYALASLFKIFSDRLQSDARLTVAPNHIYIENRNAKGDFKNVELTTNTFPGDGSIQTLTYTTHELIMSGMAQRMLNDTAAVALNLIYLAKGYQHAFNNNTDDFILNCATTAFKHDSLSLNALLLKAELTENRLFEAMQKNNIKTVAQTRKNTNTQTLLATYEKQLSFLYKLGYREIPKDIQQVLLSAMQGNKDGYITTDKTPNPFASIGKNQRYASLSWGVFDETHTNVDTVIYFNTSFNTKNKKVISFEAIDSTKINKVDPVVFACSVDPLAHKYPSLSPYAFVANNPIYNIEVDGRYFTGNTATVKAVYAITSALAEKGNKDAIAFKAALEKMDASDIEFHLTLEAKKFEGQGEHGSTTFDFKNNRIEMTVNDYFQNAGPASTTASAAHEIEHGAQFNQDEIDFYDRKGNGTGNGLPPSLQGAYDRTDEEIATDIQAMVEKEISFKDHQTIDKNVTEQKKLYTNRELPKTNVTKSLGKENSTKYMSSQKYKPTEKQKNEAKKVLTK